MKWQIKLSSWARQDIQAALDWTLANFGRNKHDEYLELIGVALNDIAVVPKSGRARLRAELHRDAWVIHIGRGGKTLAACSYIEFIATVRSK